MDIIKTDRLILREFRESDAGSVYRYAKDPEVGPIAGWPVHTSVEDSLRIIKTVLMVDETYAITLKDNDEAIGAIGLMIDNSNIKLKSDEAELGFWLGREYWGEGIMTEAVNALMNHAFLDLKMDSVLCGYFDGNDRSKRVQEKCGFTYVRTDKDMYWKQTGDVRTEHITKLSKKDWESRF